MARLYLPDDKSKPGRGESCRNNSQHITLPHNVASTSSSNNTLCAVSSPPPDRLYFIGRRKQCHLPGRGAINPPVVSWLDLVSGIGGLWPDWERQWAVLFPCAEQSSPGRSLQTHGASCSLLILNLLASSCNSASLNTSTLSIIICHMCVVIAFQFYFEFQMFSTLGFVVSKCEDDWREKTRLVPLFIVCILHP